jgi:4-alpha-glucanotransferase
MNMPSRIHDNWGWRFHCGDLKPEIATKLATLTELADREPETPGSSAAK